MPLPIVPPPTTATFVISVIAQKFLLRVEPNGYRHQQEGEQSCNAAFRSKTSARNPWRAQSHSLIEWRIKQPQTPDRQSQRTRHLPVPTEVHGGGEPKATGLQKRERQ